MLEVENCQGMIAVNGDSKEITDEDVRNVASAALVRSIPPERQIVSILPQDFTVDGFEGNQRPSWNDRRKIRKCTVCCLPDQKRSSITYVNAWKMPD